MRFWIDATPGRPLLDMLCKCTLPPEPLDHHLPWLQDQAGVRMQNQKLSVSAQQHARHKAVLSALLKQEENRRCADCSSRGPTWASVNLGVFVCLNCSGERPVLTGRRIRAHCQDMQPKHVPVWHNSNRNKCLALCPPWSSVQVCTAAWVCTTPRCAPRTLTRGYQNRWLLFR